MENFLQLDLIILFFILGALASWGKVDLKLPEAISQFLSIYLLLSIGLKGGHEVRAAENLVGFFPVLFLGLASCIFIPLVVFYLAKKRFSIADGAALASCYGSVSVVTFVVSQNFLESKGVSFSGFMVAVLAMMETPAILVALSLFHFESKASGGDSGSSLRLALGNKSVVLLLGGFVVGFLMDLKGWAGLTPLVKDLFKGFLIFYLMDLGVTAQKQLKEVWKRKYSALLFSWALPLTFGCLVMLLSRAIGIQMGNGILVSVLAGSASYIAAPAAIRMTIPQASPSIYVSLPLALTFPFNIIVAMPIYYSLATFLWR